MKIQMFSAIALLSTTVFAQQIQEIKTESKTISEGATVKFEITLNGQGRCGVQINFGDGSTSDLRVEDATKSVITTKTYPAKGTYKIEVSGKTLIRGLNSFSPCNGSQKIEVSVGTNEKALQVTDATNGSKPVVSVIEQVPSTQIKPTSGEFSFRTLCGEERKPCTLQWNLKELSAEVDRIFEKYKNDQSGIVFLKLDNEPGMAKLRSVAETATIPQARGMVFNLIGALSLSSGSNSFINLSKAAELNDVFGITNLILFRYYQDLNKNDIQFIEQNKGPNFTKIGLEEALRLLETHLQQIDRFESDQNRANRAKKNISERLTELKQIRLNEQTAEAKRIESAKAKLENTKAAANKGVEFARETGNSWKIYEKKDELKGTTLQFARSILKIDNGEATTDIYCEEKNVLSFEITTKNIQIPIRLTNRGQRLVDGRIAENDKVFNIYYTASDKFNNVINGKIFYKSTKDAFFGTDTSFIAANVQQSAINPDTQTVYRMIFEIPTSKSPLIIKIPPLAPVLRTIMQSCG